MPPLISEESEESTEESRVVSDAASQAGMEPETADSAAHAAQAETASSTANGHEVDQATEAPVDAADDSDLVAQLQRSAQEEDGDGEEAESVQADEVMEDTAEAQPGELSADSEAEEPQDGVEQSEQPTEQDEAESDADENEKASANGDGSGSGSSEESGDEDEEEDDDEDEKDDEKESSDDDEEDDENEEEKTSADEDDEEESESEEEEDENDTETCIFCKKTTSVDEDQANVDIVKCHTCSKTAHPQCARDEEALKSDEDVSQWRCPTCLKLTDSESPKSVLARARASNSAPRLVRDLLPVSRGVQKPNAHSIFEQPLISDGEDGGRALRKRKSPTQEPPPTDKRRKKAAAANSDTVAVDVTPKDRAVAHSTRSALHPAREVPLARILQHRPFHKPPPHKFILAFKLGQERIGEILSKPPKPGRRARKQKQPKIPPPPVYQPPVPKFPALPSGNLFLPSLFSERESDAKPYGGILSEQDADTSRSLPQHRDREIFEVARKEAEEERRRTSEAAEAEINGDNSVTGKPNRTVSGPPSKIKCIQFGKYVIDTFYAAPYPEEYSHESRLFICEFCLKYLPSEFVAYRHKLKCPAKHPPGDEIYRDGTVSIWEVDGRKKTEYCQCLCLMAKMFLGSKTLYYDVEPFLFYILTEYDETGYHFVGYFSKEKRPASQNNVSCILVMPIHQRKGYATFLIDFSYLLTRIEEKEGSPEKPLSDMGLTAYRAYWDLTISRHLLNLGMKPFSTKTLMALTGMTADDVIHSLERLYAFTKDPVTKTYAIRYDKKLYETIVTDFDSKKHRKLIPERLIWTPYVMGRSDQAHLDNQPMQTIAPREEDVEEEDESKPATEAVSPKTTSAPFSRAPTEPEVDAVAPGPPSTEAMEDVPKVNGIEPDLTGESLSGYALAYRTLNIPAMRFQITPPIPPSMLRNRSMKKRNAATAFGRLNSGPGKPSPTPALATRSSPRTVGSVNGRSSRGGSEEKTLTPVRRSGRRSGLANVELASLDGSNDKEDEDTDVMEIEVAGTREESSGGSAEESGEEEESEEEEDEDEEDEEEVDDDDDDEKDPDAEPDEEEGSSSSEEEDGEEDDAEEGAAEVEELAADQSQREESEDVDAEGEDDEDEDAPGEDDV